VQFGDGMQMAKLVIGHQTVAVELALPHCYREADD
jgi:hypothetical protein